MKLLKYIERINLLHKLIRESRTGAPAELARRLDMSTSRLYQLLEELRIMGVPISYCRQLKSYQYTSGYKLEASLSMMSLSETETIRGGFCEQNFLIFFSPI